MWSSKNLCNMLFGGTPIFKSLATGLGILMVNLWEITLMAKELQSEKLVEVLDAY